MLPAAHTFWDGESIIVTINFLAKGRSVSNVSTAFWD